MQRKIHLRIIIKEKSLKYIDRLNSKKFPHKNCKESPSDTNKYIK